MTALFYEGLQQIIPGCENYLKRSIYAQEPTVRDELFLAEGRREAMQLFAQGMSVLFSPRAAPADLEDKIKQ